MERLSLQILMLAIIGSLFSPVANAEITSHTTTEIGLKQADGSVEVVGETQSVIDVSELDSQSQDAQAARMNELLEGVPNARVVLVEIPNAQGGESARKNKAIEALRARLNPKNIYRVPHAGAIKLAEGIELFARKNKETLQDKDKSRLYYTKIAVGTLVPTVMVLWANGMGDVQNILHTLQMSLFTGVMGSQFVVFDDTYSGALRFRHVTSAFMKSRWVNAGLKQANMLNLKTKRLLRNVGTNFDQTITGQLMEYVYLIASQFMLVGTVDLAGAIHNGSRGGFAQSWVDAAISEWEAGEVKRIENSREDLNAKAEKIKAVKKKRSFLLVANSNIQVLIVQGAQYHVPGFDTALWIYFAGGAITKAFYKKALLYVDKYKVAQQERAAAAESRQQNSPGLTRREAIRTMFTGASSMNMCSAAF